MRAVFGQSFVVLPRFSFDAAGATEFTNALAASTAAQGGDPLAVNTWFARCARVRDTVGRMGSCLQRAGSARCGARLNLSVAQLPFVAGERWVGLPPVAGNDAAAEQAVARGAHHRPDQHDAGDDRPAGGRMGRDRAEHPRDHGAGVSVRRAGLVRAAERADRRAAGARTGLDRRDAAARADGDARSREAARRGHRDRSARPRSICPASISRSTPRTTPCPPTSRRSRDDDDSHRGLPPQLRSGITMPTLPSGSTLRSPRRPSGGRSSRQRQHFAGRSHERPRTGR